MRKHLPLPYPADDHIGLADWLELHSILAKDKSCSRADLERILEREGCIDRNDVETKCSEVFLEIESRMRSTPDAYPFTIDRSKLIYKKQISESPVYFFCLFLSFFSNRIEKIRFRSNPRRLFEDISCYAAKCYIGHSVRFASPRAELPSDFGRAVASLCISLKEGEGFKKSKTACKDDTLDVVAWKSFPDKMPGKIILFGQCASGNNWDTKISELNPRAFVDDWMLETFAIDIVKAFFIPHRIDHRQWKRVSRRAGLIMDRCRIAHYSHLPNNLFRKTIVQSAKEIISKNV